MELDFICYTSKRGNPCTGMNISVEYFNIITVLDPVAVAVGRLGR
jgi:hypothetical protein